MTWRRTREHALILHDRVLALRPRFAPAELGRAWALAKLGRADEASRALDRAAELGAPAAHVARQSAAHVRGWWAIEVSGAGNEVGSHTRDTRPPE